MTARSRHVVILSALFAATLVAHLYWNVQVHRAPSWDQAAHLTKGLAYADAIRNGTFVHEYATVGAIYPPAYQILLGLAMLVVGPIADAALYVNLVALAVIVLATYWLGSRLSSPRAGCVAAALVLLVPGMAVYPREALQETVLTAVTVVSIALLLATEFFDRRRASLWLGLALGIGFLVKPNFAFGLWLPMLVAVAVALRHASRRRLTNMVPAVAVTAALTASWYVPQLDGLRYLQLANREDAVAYGLDEGVMETVMSIWLSTRVELVTELGAWLGLAAIGAGVLWSLRRLWPLHAWIAGTWSIVAFVLIFRDGKYMLPTLPAAAILIADLLERIPFARIRMGVSLALALALATSWSSMAFGWPHLGAFRPLYVESQHAGMVGGEPSLAAMVARMAESAGSRVAPVGVVPNLERFNANTLRWEARRARAALEFEHISYSGRSSRDGTLRTATRVDWVLIKTGDQGKPDILIDAAEDLNRFVRGSPEIFHLAGTFPLSDGSQAELYRVVAPSVVAASDAQIADVVAGADLPSRDATFGGRFRLLGVAIQQNTGGIGSAQGIVIRLAWEAVVTGPLDRTVGVHIVNDQGTILAGADYPQLSRPSTVRQGTRWIDEQLVSTINLSGATQIGLLLYLADERLTIDRGPRDWNGERLLVPLPPRPPGRN